MLGESSLEQDSSWKSVPHERIVKKLWGPGYVWELFVRDDKLIGLQLII